ncbi:LacI family transcriptional regulator [Zhihengliuella salsuginis]|uniref:LacI family transcriptional regulator n=1 Tax=Zhihengliuella salsuginis TaxID=578222 RepID=A0ABQ3GCC9_9MICC|nr:LacI family DNA-binding transcriptional regulator [Zhihengliuella salsuginis]GHD00125.1 LacI family transcriptional regulator [Zhihengliuella salsuginis]
MRTASVKDVADRAGVSVGTVSNVLNNPDRVAERTRERVQSAIADLGFVRNDAARQLRAGHSRTIGLVVLDAANPFYAALARGAEEEATRHNFSLLLASSLQDADREHRYIDLFEEQRVQGLLLSPVGETAARVADLAGHGVSTVLVDRDAEAETYGSVSVDDVHGGRIAVEHLLETGRRRIAFVAAETELRQVADRWRGARDAVAQEPSAGASIELVEAHSLTTLGGRAATLSLLEREPADIPDAIFCANDLLATGALQAFIMDGRYRVPDDVALVGYDDIEFASSAIVPLTTIRRPAEELGRTAVRMLLGDTASEHTVFRPELIARASTGSR